MKRRDALKSMAAITAAVSAPEALFPQQPATRTAETAAETSGEAVALPLALAEEVAEPVTRFFTPEEMAAFRRLADSLVPRTRTPGALDAGAPEFLDFYLGQSPASQQTLYREGLARLLSEARRHFGKALAELGANELDKLLAPLRQPWTAGSAPDPLAGFLRAAKDDLLRATINSRAWALATEGRRRSTGATYWYPVE